jgi:glycosyltransferase involved in cell wall biosynthesis
MAYPDLAILIVTYNRKEVLHQTIANVLQHISYSGALRLFVADDGSTDGTQEMIRDSYPLANLIQSKRVGLGANCNAGLATCWSYTPYTVQLQDDMVPKAPMNMDRHVQKLMRDETAGYIRLWGIGGHRYVATLQDQSPDLGAHYGAYWQIHWDCPELYVASDRPHIKHQRFHARFGMYPTGLTTSMTEEVWCKQTKAVASTSGFNPNVLVPHGMETESNWDHVGWDIRWRDKGL